MWQPACVIFDGTLRPGLAGKTTPSTTGTTHTTAVVTAGTWRQWQVQVRRVGARETTAVLFLDDGQGQMVGPARLAWDPDVYEPRRLRAGIGLTSSLSTATIDTDELRLHSKS